MVVAPTIAAYLLPSIGVPGIMILDFTTFLMAVSVLILRRFPEPKSERTAAAHAPFKTRLKMKQQGV